MDKSKYAPTATGFPPVLNLHAAGQSFDSHGLTKDDVLATLEGKVVSLESHVKEAESGKKADRRTFLILQVELVDTNVLKSADGVPVLKGKTYTVYCDGNLAYNLGIKTDRDDLASPAGVAELSKWTEEHEGDALAIDYKGGSKITKGPWKGKSSHMYEVGWAK